MNVGRVEAGDAVLRMKRFGVEKFGQFVVLDGKTGPAIELALDVVLPSAPEMPWDELVLLYGRPI